MTGENDDLLKRTINVVKTTLDHPVWQAASGGVGRNAWGHNPILDQSLACPVQHMILAMNPPPATKSGESLAPPNKDLFLGFKTIRFHESSAEKRKEAVSSVKEYLPCSRVLVNYRSDTHSQAKSIHQAFLNGSETKTISAVEHRIELESQMLLNIAAMFGPEQSFVLDSTKWTKNISALNEAVLWLGFSKSCWFPFLLEFNIDTYGNGKNTTLSMPKDCRYIGDGQLLPETEEKPDSS
jgi:hypothetical protein